MGVTVHEEATDKEKDVQGCNDRGCKVHLFHIVHVQNLSLMLFFSSCLLKLLSTQAQISGNLITSDLEIDEANCA